MKTRAAAATSAHKLLMILALSFATFCLFAEALRLLR